MQVPNTSRLPIFQAKARTARTATITMCAPHNMLIGFNVHMELSKGTCNFYPSLYSKYKEMIVNAQNSVFQHAIGIHGYNLTINVTTEKKPVTHEYIHMRADEPTVWTVQEPIVDSVQQHYEATVEFFMDHHTKALKDAVRGIHGGKQINFDTNSIVPLKANVPYTGKCESQRTVHW
jgi:hypothetical protein